MNPELAGSFLCLGKMQNKGVNIGVNFCDLWAIFVTIEALGPVKNCDLCDLKRAMFTAKVTGLSYEITNGYEIL